MSEFLVIPRSAHDELVSRAYQARGFTSTEAAEGAKLAAEAARHGIRTHHALKALHLDHLFGLGARDQDPLVDVELERAELPSPEHVLQRFARRPPIGQEYRERAHRCRVTGRNSLGVLDDPGGLTARAQLIGQLSNQRRPPRRQVA